MTVAEARECNKALKEKKDNNERAKANLSVAETQLDKAIANLGEILGEEVTRENVAVVVKKQTSILEAQRDAIKVALGN